MHFCSNNVNFVRRFCTSRASSLYYDVAIVGGGLVGSAMACAIGIWIFQFQTKFFDISLCVNSGRQASLASKKVLLLDSLKTYQPKVSNENWYSNRVSSIAPSSVHLFESKIGYFF